MVVYRLRGMRKDVGGRGLGERGWRIGCLGWEIVVESLVVMAWILGRGADGVVVVKCGIWGWNGG